MINPLSDEARYPDLSAHGKQMLDFLREHPNAPRYTAQCGHRLTAERLERVREFAGSLQVNPAGWTPGGLPPWIAEFIEMCYREVPFYRRHGAQPEQFADIPTFGRDELSREPWAFVPDSLPLEGIVLYNTSGTTGHPLTVLSHPVTSASYLPLLRVALAAYGITLTSGRGQVAYLLVGWQRKSYAYPSVVPEMDEAGCAKLNLHPDDWRDPDDRAKFLDACNPEFYTGDPIAFAEMARLPLRTRPRALLSTAMMLLPGLKRDLEARFGCPVIDIYSMNECGPIAYADPAGEGHVLLQPRLYAELVDEEEVSTAPGPSTSSVPGPSISSEPDSSTGSRRGEIVLSGGMNSFLPLLRYRTNDFAGLSYRGTTPILTGLQGRKPTLFRTAAGAVINTLDVTHALAPLPLPRFALHQAVDGSLTLRIADNEDPQTVEQALRSLFGADQALSVETVESVGDKQIQFSSEFAP